ncbi:MAG TPA: T9SS type A sorting domain-containing protein [Candidatus Eisenbacteria bacterium]|nr:T9SS type A sorting domain-containing protein [Candidatus Eisenbacteria bacterium]
MSAATLFGLIDTGELYQSVNNGATWTPLSTLPTHDAVGLAARLSSSDLFLATRSGSIYRSTNAGATWAAVGAISASDLVDLSIKPDGTLLALTATGSLYGSADLGASFGALAALTAPNFASLTHTTPVVKHYALTRTGEVYESLDGGATWTPKGAMAVSNARRIRAVQSSLYVLTETGDVFRSTDAATTWTPIGTLSQIGMQGLVRNGNALAAASREGHVATSADGIAWTWAGSMNQLTLTTLASNEPATTGVGPGPSAAEVFMGAPRPNPSTGSAAFDLRLEREADVALTIYDMAGRAVARRSAERYTAGQHRLTWTPGSIRTGLYFLRVETSAGDAATRRWVVVR